MTRLLLIFGAQPMRARSYLLLLVATGVPWFAALAQYTFTTDARVNLRQGPSTASRVKRVLAPLEQVEVADTSSRTNGFYEIRTSRGETGWVAADYLFATVDDTSTFTASVATRVIGLDAPMDTLSENWERPPVARSTLRNMETDERCGPRGDPEGDGPTFLLKNRSDSPTLSYAVTFEALEGLPYDTGGLKKDRTQWTRAQLNEVRRFEGVPLTITGFLAAVRPQKGNREGTNCAFRGEENTDWHMALVPTHRAAERNAIVVEPTPRIKRRHPNWRAEELAPWVGTARSRSDSVRITGYLFYDPDHKNHIGTYRRTMWELHPVTRIEVFLNGRWIDLDDFGGQ